MNLLDQLLGDASQSERLRQLYAEGKNLPWMRTAEWVWSQPKTALGMVRLPHVATTVVSEFHLPESITIVLQFVLGAGFFWTGYSARGDGGNATYLLLLGSAILLAAVFSFFDYRAQLWMCPEAATIEYAPGGVVLLMLPRRRAATSLVYSQLVFREHWYVTQGNSGHWKERQLKSIPVTFEHAGANLMTASISLPKDAPISYHTTHYRHEWVLAISHVPWWGFTRTDHYLLWIGDGQ